MITVYRTTDRIPVKIGEVTFWLSPLTQHQKGTLASLSSIVSGVEVEKSLDAAALSLKYSIKDVEGVVYSDNTPMQLHFEEDGTLTQESVDELITLVDSHKLVSLALKWALESVADPKDIQREYIERLSKQLAAGEITKEKFEFRSNNYQLKGVEVDFSKVRNIKKKQSEDSPAQA